MKLKKFFTNKNIFWVLILINFSLILVIIFFTQLISSLASLKKEKEGLTSTSGVVMTKIAKVKILNFRTDKDTYSSHERIELTLRVLSEEEINEATVKITGIKSGEYFYIDETETINLKKGENLISLSAKTPSCTSGCGGVHPGPYEIQVSIFIQNKLVDQAKTIINLLAG